jgi:hypothetical protein
MLLKYAQITIELRVFFNLLLQQISDSTFALKSYILRRVFKVNSMCDTFTKSNKRDSFNLLE